MVDIPTRRRPLALLAIVVVAQVLLLAFQVRHTDRSQDHDVPLVRYWAAAIITPIERAGSSMLSGIGGVWTGYIDLRHERSENLRLRAENGQLKLRNRELETQATEEQRLSTLLEFRKEHPEAPMVGAQVVGSSTAMLAAQVIGGSADPTSQTIFINRGSNNQIRRNMAVITPDGIVGKIVEVFPGTAQVLLISDRESGVGAMFADTRTHGIVKGNGSAYPEMDYIVNDEKVHVGDSVITSGDDRIFPKGLPVGVVSEDKSANPFQVIRLQPAAHLDRLEDVLVLLTEKELTLKETGATAPADPEHSAFAPPSSQPHAPTPAPDAAKSAPKKR
jgi:rod shape-determining protein MreC